MKRRRLHRWIVWLLPLLVLRAFVPAGFMLAASADGLQMVVCAGGGPAAMGASPDPAASAHHPSAHGGDAAHGGHAHHASLPADESARHHSSSAHPSFLCAFAVAGTADAPAPQVVALLDAAIADSPGDFIADPELTSLAILIDRIRGPPNA